MFPQLPFLIQVYSRYIMYHKVICVVYIYIYHKIILSFHIYIYYIYIEWASALVPPTILLRRGPAERDRHSHPTQPCWSARAQLCKHSTAQEGHHFDLETLIWPWGACCLRGWGVPRGW